MAWSFPSYIQINTIYDGNDKRAGHESWLPLSVFAHGRLGRISYLPDMHQALELGIYIPSGFDSI